MKKKSFFLNWFHYQDKRETRKPSHSRRNQIPDSVIDLRDGRRLIYTSNSGLHLFILLTNQVQMFFALLWLGVI